MDIRFVNIISSKSKVTVDIGPLLEDLWTGIPIYTRRLVKALLQNDGLDVDFSFNFARFPRDGVKAALRLGTGTFLRNDFESWGGSNYGLVDPGRPLLFPSSKGRGGFISREASTIHDMSTLFMPENHVEDNVAHHLDHLTNELETDEVIFCISEATQAALTSALPSTAAKTRLIYQYVDWPDNFDILERNLPRLTLGRYALVIGTIEPRKNLNLLINTLGYPEIAGHDLRFIVIGKRGWQADAILDALTHDEQKRIVFSGFVTEFMKYRLIKGSEFLLFPSVYEGFGIPALEAMSLGKPVLASRTSSFPELIGDAGIYFDPFSSSELAAAIGELSNPRKIADLAQNAIKRSKLFGYCRMAEPIINWLEG